MEASKTNTTRSVAEISTPLPAPAGQPLCIEQAFERYLEPVFHYVSRRVPGREEAEDITAEVFAVLSRSRPRVAGEGALYLWLLGIARRKIADSLRRGQRRPETLASQLPPHQHRGDAAAPQGSARLEEIAGAAENPEDNVIRRERRRVVRELMSELHPDQREALLLKYVEGLSVAEVAVTMHRSPSAVNSLLQRARATLFQRGQAYFLNAEVGDD